jgi:hypothetical protein
VSSRLLSPLAVVAALTCYHLARGSMPGALRPAPLLAFVYAAATVIMLAVVTEDSPRSAVRELTASASHRAPWLLVASRVQAEGLVRQAATQEERTILQIAQRIIEQHENSR